MTIVLPDIDILYVEKFPYFEPFSYQTRQHFPLRVVTFVLRLP